MMFNKLTPNEYQHLLPFFSNQTHRLCYYSLSSFIAWGAPDSYPVWHIEGEKLFIGMHFTEKKNNNYLTLPVANGKVYSPKDIHNFASTYHFGKYRYVPEDYLKIYAVEDIEAYFEIREQPKYEDYIFRTSDLAELKGKKYSKKRNLINQFVKNYYDKGIVEIAPITTSDIDECLEFMETWDSSREFDEESSIDAAFEKNAAINALTNIDILGFKGVLLRIQGKVQAFGIGSKLTDDLGGFNFEKAAPDIKGLYQFFDKQCVRRLFQDFPYVNKECDMGLPGLRQAKRSYYPVSTVKSYQLFLK